MTAPAPAVQPLTRGRHERATGYVWCFEHGSIHDDTNDPYGTGEPDCHPANFRPVYVALRKGDYPEAAS